MARGRQAVWFAVVAALTLAVGSVAGEGGFRRYVKLEQGVRALRERAERLSEDNARLRKEVEALRSDNRAIERAAREELGLIRPGELVFIVADEAGRAPPSAQGGR